MTHRKKVWLKRIAIAFGSLLVLLAALVALAGYLLSQPRETKLGGNWILSEPHSLVIDSGAPPKFLKRVHGRERVTVANQPYSLVYIGNDCLVFAEHVPELHRVHVNSRYAIKAACGDRPPIMVDYKPDFVWQRELEPDPARINGKEIPWAEIRQHAERGESFVQP